jgi:hypothetical protein
MLKNNFTLLILVVSLGMFLNPKNTVAQCSDFEIDSLYFFPNLTNGVCQVINSGSTYFVYPIYTIVSDENPYLEINYTSIASTLDSAGGATNGLNEFLVEAELLMNFEDMPINATVTGTVTIEDPNNEDFFCSLPFTWNLKPGTTTSVASVKKKHLAFYPNPTKRFVSFEREKDLRNVIILDTQGRIVDEISYLRSGELLDLSRMEKGVLFIQARSGNDLFTGKIIYQ